MPSGRHDFQVPAGRGLGGFFNTGLHGAPSPLLRCIVAGMSDLLVPSVVLLAAHGAGRSVGAKDDYGSHDGWKDLGTKRGLAPRFNSRANQPQAAAMDDRGAWHDGLLAEV